jgi:hypothetical protein
MVGIVTNFRQTMMLPTLCKSYSKAHHQPNGQVCEVAIYDSSKATQSINKRESNGYTFLGVNCSFVA